MAKNTIMEICHLNLLKFCKLFRNKGLRYILYLLRCEVNPLKTIVVARLYHIETNIARKK